MQYTGRMKTAQTTTKPATKLGPGEYKPEGIYLRMEDLPEPRIIQEDRNARQRSCPFCGQMAKREKVYERHLHDVGDLVSGRPVELTITYSQHHCRQCNRHFMTDLSDVAPTNSHYTHRVIALAVRVVGDGAYRWPAGSCGVIIGSLCPLPPSGIKWMLGEKRASERWEVTI